MCSVLDSIQSRYFLVSMLVVREKLKLLLKIVIVEYKIETNLSVHCLFRTIADHSSNCQSTMTTTPTTISIDPKIDLIIEFSIKTKNKKEEIELKEEYKNLINLLNEIELNSTSRLGNKNSDTLLIFIKASEIKLKNELIKER